jgi:putative ATPase
MDELFDEDKPTDTTAGAQAPLAARMRPRTLDEVVGQDHMLGPGKPLRRRIEADRLGSIILYGPPGCGKTSLAEVIARATKRRFERTSGVVANVAILRAILEKAHAPQAACAGRGDHPLHRRDPPLQQGPAGRPPALCRGGAHHPDRRDHPQPVFLHQQPPHLPLPDLPTGAAHRRGHSSRLLRARPRGRPARPGHHQDPRPTRRAGPPRPHVCEGDARRALNALEVAVADHAARPTVASGRCRRAVVEESIQKKAVVYDRDEDGHYDTISAFIKSVRGSDPNAALYWLAKMLLRRRGSALRRAPAGHPGLRGHRQRRPDGR